MSRLVLLLSSALLFAIGLIMVFNTSAAEILDRSLSKSTYYALIKQITYALVGALASLPLWFLGYRHFLRLSFPFLCFFTFLLVLCFLPGIGQGRNGAHRWIGFGGYTIQPSEFVKILIPSYVIYYVMTSQEKILSLKSFCVLLAIISIPMGLILIEPDTGTTAILGAMLVMLFFLTRIPYKYWLLPICVMGLIAVGVASQMPHIRHRLNVYLNPEADLKGKGHQPFQARIAAGSGGALGKGLGQSLQKMNYLPEAQNDYIAAIVAEEFGYVGMLIIIALYLGVVYAGFHISMQAPDLGGFYLGSMLTLLLGFQALLNLGVVSGLLPSKGLNLPLMSQGGTSLMANILSVTLLLNIGYEGEKAKKKMILGQINQNTRTK